MTVYTKRGDAGKTSLLIGRRISKSSEIINLIGSIDELNSFLGMIGGQEEVQRNLFTINAILAGAKLSFAKEKVKDLEKKIDEIEGKLPVQTKFLIYGGDRKAGELYFARSVARRAERMFVKVFGMSKKYPQILAYLNRLSDYLFVLARSINFKKKIKEELF